MLNNKDLTINNYIEAVRYKYWKIIFDSKMFQEIFTTNLKCEYESRLYDFKKYDITFTKRERYIAQINVLKMSKTNKYKILNGTIFQLYSRYIYYNQSFSKI